MAVSKELIRQAVEAVSEVEGVFMNADSLVEDIILLAYAFPEENDFMAACSNTQYALESLVQGKVTSSDLKYEFEDWKSYHYQRRVGQGTRATCRIMYRKTDEGVEVKGFGHRRIPEDFYARMGAAKRT